MKFDKILLEFKNLIKELKDEKNHLINCPTCGAHLKNHSCEYCGFSQAQKIDSEKSSRDYLITFWSCLLLGFFGIHHFYSGKVFWGIVFFLTGGLFGLGWFWDLFLITIQAYKDGDGKYITPNKTIFTY